MTAAQPTVDGPQMCTGSADRTIRSAMEVSTELNAEELHHYIDQQYYYAEPLKNQKHDRQLETVQYENRKLKGTASRNQAEHSYQKS